MRPGDKASDGKGSGGRKRRRRGRKLLVALGLLLVLVVVLVALAPTIASGVAPGIIEGRVNPTIAGRVEVGSVSLSWTGPQRVTGVRLFDPDGTQAADVSVRTGAGLVGLASGNMDLGEVLVAGWASAEPGDDGRTRIQRAIEPTAVGAADGGDGGAGGGAGSIPQSLRATVRLDAFEVRTGVGAVVLDGDAGVAPGSPVTLALVGAEGGREVVRVDATVLDLIGADGSITIGKAGVDATASLKDAPTALLDALAGLGFPLVDLLGERVAADASAKGTMDALEASFSVESDGVSARGGVRKTGELIEQVGEIRVRADGARVARAMPALREALVESASVDFQTWPVVTLEVTGLRAPLDSVRAGDYRGLGGVAKVSATNATALVPLSGGDGASGTLELAGLALTLSAPDLGGAVSLRGGASATLDGQDAGALTIELEAPGLLGEDGALLDPGAAAVSGGVTLAGVAAQTIQPFVDAAGLDVARDVGKTITLHATASRAGDDRNQVEVSLDASRVRARLSAEIEGRIVRGGARPGELTLLDPTPTLAAFLGESGVAVERVDGPITITLEALEIDLDRLLGDDGTDLRAISAVVGAAIPGGVVAMGSESGARTLGASGVSLRLDAGDIASGVNLSGGGNSAVNGAPAGAFTLGGRVGDLFDAAGRLAAGGASLDATLELPGVPASTLQGLVPENPVEVEADVGAVVDATVVVHKGSGADTPIEIDVRAGGERARLIGALAYADTGVRTRGDGIVLRQNSVGRLVNRLGVLPAGARIERVASGLELRVTSLNVPRTPDGGLDLDGASVGARVDFAGGQGSFGDAGTFKAGALGVTLDRRAGEMAKYTLSVASLEVRSGADDPGVALGADLGGEVGWAVLTGGSYGDASAAGTLRLAEAGGGAKLGEVKIDGRAPIGGAGAATLRASGDVASLARVERAIGSEGLLTGALGDTASFDATWTAAAFDPADPMASWEATASVQSPRLKTQGQVRASAGDGVVRLLEPARASWTVDPVWATKMALGEGAGVRLDAPVAMNVRIDRLEAPTSGDGRPVVEAAFTSDAVVFKTDDGRRLEYTGLDASAKSAAGSESVEVRATMATKGAAADAPKAVEVVASVFGLGGESGDELVTGYANVRDAPTAVIDAMTDMDGLLLAFLGDRSSAHVRARGLSRSAGSLTMSLTSTHATASYEGRVQDGSLVSTKPTQITVNEVTKAFGFELAKIIPVFGSIEKRAGTDRPATIVIDTLSLPVDGRDLVQNLAATMRIDPGDASLTIDGGMGRFLKTNEGVKVGRRMKAFPVNVAGGAVNYDGVEVPLGEFALSVGGKVDLVNKTQDVRVGVPAGALAAEAAGGEGAIGQIFDRALGVSLVNKGAMGSKGWELKLGGGGGGDRKPGDALRDLFENIGGKRDGGG